MLPASTAVLSVVRGGERPSLGFWLAAGFGLVAVIGFAAIQGAGRPQPADVLVLIAVLLGALGYSEGGALSREIGGWRVISWALVLAIPLLAPVVGLSLLRTTVHPTAGAWLGFGYVAVVSTYLGFFPWYRALALGGVARISQIQLAQPILTLVWSALLLSERIDSSTVVAAGLVLVSVGVSQRMRVRHLTVAGMPDEDRVPGEDLANIRPTVPASAIMTRVPALRKDCSTMTGHRDRFLTMKQAGKPIVMLTCYDYPTAVIEDEAGIDMVLVGDSVGTNVLGYASETEVTMDDIVHHLKAVRRGIQRAYLLADLPYRSYDTPEDAIRNAEILLAAGADGVKLEGGVERVDVVRALVARGIDVCGHIGFTPQTLGSKGRVQGKSYDRAWQLVESAEALEAAGIMMLVLELVTEQVSKAITKRLRIPTIGIGSGQYCDGQVLVLTDVLGLSPFTMKIAKRYARWREAAEQAIRQYRDDVTASRFPTTANAFPVEAEALERLEASLAAAK
jgi:3-methyl-2-oxobutanoate hydroxymethyltransferase